MARIIDVPVSEDLIAAAAAALADHDPRNLLVVFPGKRPGHAFRKAWAGLKGGPCLSPGVTSMEGLLHSAAGIAEGRALPEADAVFLLFQTFRDLEEPAFAGITSDLGSFYPWGAAWVKAIDELDREQVPGESLREIRHMEELAALPEKTEAFYARLPDLRKAYHTRIREYGRPTRGLLYGRATERLEEGSWQPPQEIALVGLFALFQGELELVKALDKFSSVTLFRHHDGRDWTPFREIQEALAPGHRTPELETSLPSLHLYALPGTHGEVLRTGEILHRDGLDPEKTAVVLPDPGPLVPLLWEVLESYDGKVNLTMGYPVTRTPLYTLLNQILTAAESRRDGRIYARDYLKVLFHPYVKNLAPPLPEGGTAESRDTRILIHGVERYLKENELTFFDPDSISSNEGLLRRVHTMTEGRLSPGESTTLLSHLHEHFFEKPARAATLGELAHSLLAVVRDLSLRSQARFHAFFNLFFGTVADGLEDLAALHLADQALGRREILHAIIRTHFESSTVPFSGLPLQGLQVLGLLETRAQSFDTVVILDANETVLPAVPEVDPVLPPTVRRALGLPGYDESVEVSRYHLFRLLESARTAHVLYKESADETRSHLVEDFLFQVQERDPAHTEPVPSTLAFGYGSESSEQPRVVKDATLLTHFSEFAFSPSHLDTYLQCPMKFYYSAGARLREAEEISERLDPRRLGTLLHRVLSDLYEPHAGSVLSEETYGEMRLRLPAAIQRTFPEGGEAALLKGLARKRLETLLDRERATLSGHTILRGVEARLQADLATGGVRVSFRGFADRIDERDGCLMITDYKSGKDLKQNIPKSSQDPIDPLSRRSVARRLRSFQLPLYAALLKERENSPTYEAVNAALVSLRNLREEPAALFPHPERADDWMATVFEPALNFVMGEILDPELVFTPDPLDPKACSDCPFATLCRMH